MTIVAKRKSAAECILWAVYGLVCLSSSIVWYIVAGISGGWLAYVDAAALTGCFAIGLGLTVYHVVKLRNTPKEIVRFEDGVLYFQDGFFSPREISDVKRKGNVLFVTVRGKEHQYRYVSDTKTVCRTLKEMAEADRENEV